MGLDVVRAATSSPLGGAWYRILTVQLRLGMHHGRNLRAPRAAVPGPRSLNPPDCPAAVPIARTHDFSRPGRAPGSGDGPSLPDRFSLSCARTLRLYYHA